LTGGAVDGAQDLTITAGSGAVTFGNIGDTAPVTSITITHSGGTTFSGDVAAGTITITDTADGQSVTFADAKDVDLTTGFTISNAGPDNYNVVINSSTFDAAGDTNFLNGGTVTLGNDSTDVITFAGGLATTGNGTNPGTVSIAGTVQTEGAQMDLGAVTLAAATTLKTDGNSATGDANINIGAVGVTLNDNLTITSTGTVDFQGVVNLGTGNLDVTIDTATEGTDTLVIDQTITANSIDFTGSGAAGNDTLDIDQNLAAGTSLTLDNLQTVAVAQDVDLSAANGDISATTNIGAFSLDGTAGENEIKTTGGAGDIVH
jgi:hypothetical protein